MPLTFNLGHTHNNKKKNKRHVPVRLKKRNQAMLERGGKKGKKTALAVCRNVSTISLENKLKLLKASSMN